MLKGRDSPALFYYLPLFIETNIEDPCSKLQGSSICKEIDYSNSLANPATSCGINARCAFSAPVNDLEQPDFSSIPHRIVIFQ